MLHPARAVNYHQCSTVHYVQLMQILTDLNRFAKSSPVELTDYTTVTNNTVIHYSVSATLIIYSNSETTLPIVIDPMDKVTDDVFVRHVPMFPYISQVITHQNSLHLFCCSLCMTSQPPQYIVIHSRNDKSNS